MAELHEKGGLSSKAAAPETKYQKSYLEGKVEGLCGEVSDDIGQVASPE